MKKLKSKNGNTFKCCSMSFVLFCAYVQSDWNQKPLFTAPLSSFVPVNQNEDHKIGKLLYWIYNHGHDVAYPSGNLVKFFSIFSFFVESHNFSNWTNMNFKHRLWILDKIIFSHINIMLIKIELAKKYTYHVQYIGMQNGDSISKHDRRLLLRRRRLGSRYYWPKYRWKHEIKQKM